MLFPLFALFLWIPSLPRRYFFIYHLLRNFILNLLWIYILYIIFFHILKKKKTKIAKVVLIMHSFNHCGHNSLLFFFIKVNLKITPKTLIWFTFNRVKPLVAGWTNFPKVKVSWGFIKMFGLFFSQHEEQIQKRILFTAFHPLISVGSEEGMKKHEKFA